MKVSNILVPTDFSKGSQEAVRLAIDMCEKLGATLHVLHVVENPFAPGAFMEMYTPPSAEYFLDLEKQAADRLRALLSDENTKRCKVVTITRTGLPTQEILQRLSEQPAIDMVVMSTHGRSGVSRFMMGSVADKVIRAAPCPVLTLREHPSGSSEAARSVAEYASA